MVNMAISGSPLTSVQGIEVLAKYGVDGENPNVRRAALRCVANALLLDPSMRQIFVDTGYSGKLAERLKVWFLGSEQGES